MLLTPPKMITLLISLILAVIGVLLHENAVTIASLEPHDFWLVAGGYALLLVGVLARGL